jgi:hypothetical protein
MVPERSGDPIAGMEILYHVVYTPVQLDFGELIELCRMVPVANVLS